MRCHIRPPPPRGRADLHIARCTSLSAGTDPRLRADNLRLFAAEASSASGAPHRQRGSSIGFYRTPRPGGRGSRKPAVAAAPLRVVAQPLDLRLCASVLRRACVILRLCVGACMPLNCFVAFGCEASTRWRSARTWKPEGNTRRAAGGLSAHATGSKDTVPLWVSGWGSHG